MAKTRTVNGVVCKLSDALALQEELGPGWVVNGPFDSGCIRTSLQPPTSFTISTPVKKLSFYGFMSFLGGNIVATLLQDQHLALCDDGKCDDLIPILDRLGYKIVIR